MPLNLGLLSNFMFPGDGSGVLWRSQVALYDALRCDAGWRYTVDMASLTFTNPNTPNFFQFTDIANQCSANGIPVVVSLVMTPNDDTSGTWETLSGDPGGWTFFIGQWGKHPPPYGTDDALLAKLADVQLDGIQIMYDAAVAAGIDPSTVIFPMLPNEMQFDFQTVGDNGTYTVPYVIQYLYDRTRERFPDLLIGSTAIGMHYEQLAIGTEIANMVAGLEFDFLDVLQTAGSTWMHDVDWIGINIYMSTDAYYTYGAAEMVTALNLKWNAGIAVLSDPLAFGPDKPIWVTEVGVGNAFCGNRRFGRESARFAYMRQGEYLTAMIGYLSKLPRVQRAYVYASCADDGNADRMFGLMVGADANIDGGVDGQWRLSALPLLRARGYRSNNPSADSPSQNWITNTAGTTATGTDIPAGSS